jgi:hypothetical protein
MFDSSRAQQYCASDEKRAFKILIPLVPFLSLRLFPGTRNLLSGIALSIANILALDGDTQQL